MKHLLFFLSLIVVGTSIARSQNTFRESQLKYTRVREAYSTKEKPVVKILTANGISRDSLRLYLRAFKAEKKIEIWAKSIRDTAYILIRELPVCELSGDVGPKRRSRDLQVPEGFYHIDELNPYSKYYLSMKINYPNASDSIRGVRGRLGNFIFIHGACISSGCLAITNERISELFVWCIEAYNSGQEEIGITMFPSRLDDKQFALLNYRYGRYKDCILLWADLKKSWDLFEQYKRPPAVFFLKDGGHEVTMAPVSRK